MMADEFNFLRPEIKNYKAEANADLIPIPGQLELHGRCRCGVLLSACFCALFVADLSVGMEEWELHCRRRDRHNFRKIKIATSSVRMVWLDVGCQTKEMNGGSSASYLARTPCVPCIMLSLIGLETEGLFRLPGKRTDNFHCMVDPNTFVKLFSIPLKSKICPGYKSNLKRLFLSLHHRIFWRTLK